MTTNADLRARQSAAVANGVATRGVSAARAGNAGLWDVEGRRYLDFAAGIAGNNTGHRHPRVMAAVAGQAQGSPIPRSTWRPAKAMSGWRSG